MVKMQQFFEQFRLYYRNRYTLYEEFARSLDPVQIQPGIDLTAKYVKFETFPAHDLIWSPPRRRLL